MLLEELILYLAWIITIICFWLFIPREKWRHAHVAIFFKQFITWVTGLEVVNLGLIEYPVRFFSNANGTSFTFEFLVYPVISAFFNIYYPENKSGLVKFIYYASICSVMTVLELLLENYTQLLRYIDWTGYLTWFSLFVTLYISRLYYRWFFKI